MNATIFIRAKNEGKFIDQCLQGIYSQETDIKFNVIILDSGSKDDTVVRASKYPIALYSIPAEIFSYSKALNFGLELCRTEYFISLSAHAIPDNREWLEHLVRPLIQDSTIAASFSRQVAIENLSKLEQRAIAREFPDVEKMILSADLSSCLEPYTLAKFSNVSSCIRMTVAKEIKFRELPFAEDRLFALEALMQGHKIFYANTSVVRHSHYPNLKDFKTVAKKATISRWKVNAFFSKLSRTAVVTPSVSTQIAAQIKLALVVLWVSILAPLRCLAVPRKLLKRDVDYRVACIGTSLGKLQALSLINRDSLAAEIPIADSKELQKRAELIKSNENE